MAGPNTIESHVAEAKALGLRGRWSKAIRSIDSALQLDPSSTAAHRAQLDIILGIPDLKLRSYGAAMISRAKKSAGALVFLHPDDPAIRHLQLRAEQLDGDTPPSVPMGPNTIDVHLENANDLAASGKWPKAIKHINAALVIDPASISTHLAHIAIIENVPDLHLAHYGSALLSRATKSGDALAAIAPDDPAAHEARARSYVLARNFPVAMEAAEHALKIDPSRPEANRIVALAHQSVNKKITKLAKGRRKRWR